MRRKRGERGGKEASSSSFAFIAKICSAASKVPHSDTNNISTNVNNSSSDLRRTLLEIEPPIALGRGSGMSVSSKNVHLADLAKAPLASVGGPV